MCKSLQKREEKTLFVNHGTKKSISVTKLFNEIQKRIEMNNNTDTKIWATFS